MGNTSSQPVIQEVEQSQLTIVEDTEPALPDTLEEASSSIMARQVGFSSPTKPISPDATPFEKRAGHVKRGRKLRKSQESIPDQPEDAMSDALDPTPARRRRTLPITADEQLQDEARRASQATAGAEQEAIPDSQLGEERATANPKSESASISEEKRSKKARKAKKDELSQENATVEDGKAQERPSTKRRRKSSLKENLSAEVVEDEDSERDVPQEATQQELDEPEAQRAEAPLREKGKLKSTGKSRKKKSEPIVSDGVEGVPEDEELIIQNMDGAQAPQGEEEEEDDDEEALVPVNDKRAKGVGKVAQWFSSQPQSPDDMLSPGQQTAKRVGANEDFEVPASPTDDSASIEANEAVAADEATASVTRDPDPVPEPGSRRKRMRKDSDKPVADKVSKKRPGTSAASAVATANATPFPSRGTFIKQEVDIVDEVLKEYQEEHRLTKAALAEKIQDTSNGRGDIKELWSRLSSALPNRNRKSLQRFCRRFYHNLSTGEWTEEEHEILKQAYAEKPNKWVFIAARVGRRVDDCRDRWARLSSVGVRREGFWTEEEENELEQAVQECIEEQRQAGKAGETALEDKDLISWNFVAKKLGGTRDRLQCFAKWKKMERRQSKTASSQPDSATQDTRTSTQQRDAKEIFEKMLPGDQYAIVQELIQASETGTYSHGHTFWMVATQMAPNSQWKTAERKAVYKRLRRQLRKQGQDSDNFNENIRLMLDLLENTYTPEQLEKQTARRKARSKGKTAKGKRPTSEDFVKDETEDEGEDIEMADIASRRSEEAPNRSEQGWSAAREIDAVQAAAEGGDDEEAIPDSEGEGNALQSPTRQLFAHGKHGRASIESLRLPTPHGDTSSPSSSLSSSHSSQSPILPDSPAVPRQAIPVNANANANANANDDEVPSDLSSLPSSDSSDSEDGSHNQERAPQA
ncbi:hypothetical protein H2203_005403 [Taxawa tesnikishii (nom. ined.)]|nr:hypothetical protein H2203_005403 [Dothideales sp. JES 119]